MPFLDLIEEEYEALSEVDEEILEWLRVAYEGEHELMKEELDLTDDEYQELTESLVRRVSADGSVHKIKTSAVRQRQAGLTTGLNKAQRKLRAKKAARTRKNNPAILKGALRKRKKALRRRKQMGFS